MSWIDILQEGTTTNDFPIFWSGEVGRFDQDMATASLFHEHVPTERIP